MAHLQSVCNNVARRLRKNEKTPSWPRVLERLKTEEGAVSYIRYAEEAGYRPITAGAVQK